METSTKPAQDTVVVVLMFLLLSFIVKSPGNSFTPELFGAGLIIAIVYWLRDFKSKRYSAVKKTSHLIVEFFGCIALSFLV